MRARAIDVRSQVKKQIGVSHRNDPRCPIDAIQIRLQGLPLRDAQFRQQRLVDKPETAVELAQAALQPHGIAVSFENNAFILKPIDAMLSDTPPTILNRADSETPDDLKPVVQFVPLTAIEPNLAHQLLQSVTTKRVKVAALQSANSVVISGPGADVSAAVSAVRTIDVQPELFVSSQVRQLVEWIDRASAGRPGVGDDEPG